MGKEVGGFGMGEVHGAGSSLGGNLGERVHSTHAGGGGIGGQPDANTGTGVAKPEKPYGGVYKKEDYEADQAQNERNEEAQTQHVGEEYRMEHMGTNQDPSNAEDYSRAKNEGMYGLAEAGNSVAASKTKDTDALLAEQRGDPQGTEYAEDGQSGGRPIATNLPVGGRRANN